MAAQRNTYQHKLVLLGESGVGKSCLALRFVRDTFSDEQEPTIGAAYLSHNVQLEDCTVKFEIWDTAGQERYRSLAPMYYRGAGAAVVVFDVGNMETFNGAKRWVAELRSKADANVVIALAGNKSDTPYCKGLSAEACTEYAQSAGILYMETSAKTGAKVKDVFNAIARALPKDQKAAVNATPLAPSSAASGSCC